VNNEQRTMKKEEFTTNHTNGNERYRVRALGRLRGVKRNKNRQEFKKKN